MTDVQVSNARRIGFTALAVVAFWVMAWRAYSNASAAPFVRPAYGGDYTWEYFILSHWWLVVGPCLALVPLVFLSLSVHNSPLRMGDRWIQIHGVVFAFSIGLSHWLGEHDAIVSIRSYAPDVILIEGHRVLEYRPGPLWHLLTEPDTSWPWLLLPIVLTTAFVIFGAWRRAVRDAEVEAVGEGE